MQVLDPWVPAFVFELFIAVFINIITIKILQKYGKRKNTATLMIGLTFLFLSIAPLMESIDPLFLDPNSRLGEGISYALTSIAMIFFDNYRFRKSGEIFFSAIGIVISISLVSIFPFDFSVIPNPTAVNIVPIAVRVFFILLPVFYGVSVIIMFLRLRKQLVEKDYD